MTVFDEYVGCTRRKCKAMSSHKDDINTIAYKRVKEFYRLAIEAFEKMSEEEINTNGRAALVVIDALVYNNKHI